jgi:hypothetical protein
MFAKAAKYYLKQGISVIATDHNKRALLPWKVFQKRLLTEQELTEQFSHTKTQGIAVICGAVSGGLEVIDIDAKNDITGDLMPRILAAVEEYSPELLQVIYTVTTKSGGMHLYYRCEVVEGNAKLASRPTTEEELKKNPLEKVKVLIETRGEAGYVIAPPTPGYTRTGPMAIPVLSIEQRDTLLSIMRSFNEVVEHVRPPRQQDTERYSKKPWEDYSERGDYYKLLQAHGWYYVGVRGENEYFRRPGKDDGVSASWHISKRLFYCFTSSTQFEPGKAYRLSSLYATLEHNSDFSAAAKALAEQGYGEQTHNYGKIERTVFKKKQEGYNKEDLVELIKNNYRKTDEEAEALIGELEQKWGDTICTFWSVDKQGNPVIMHSRLIQFLSTNGGFYLYFYDKGSTIFKTVRVIDGLVEESSTEQMKKFLAGYIERLPDSFDGGINPEQLLEAVNRGSATLFTEAKMEWMQHITFNFLKDRKDKAYFPFKNGIAVVDRKGSTMMNYGDINGYIWRNQVVDFNIQLLAEEEVDCEYARFLQKICGESDERYLSCVTFIGYLLHRYKDPARPWSVILAEETENEDKGGGTGKGIFVKALQCLLKTVKIDGKTFSIDKNFALQRVSLDTQLIAVEDCDRKIDFEKFNAQLTEGSTVEKKNKDELFIEYKDSPKWIFTTNYVMNVKGNHGKRRSKTFEVFPYFSPEHTPFDEFGHLLFDDWDPDEWNRFYNFLFGCLSLYLDRGLIEYTNSEKLKRKQIKLQFGEDFLEWWGDYLGLNPEENRVYENPKSSIWCFFKDLYNEFLKSYDLEKKEYSIKRFKKALEISAEVFGLELQGRRNQQNNGLWEYKIKNRVYSESATVVDSSL